MKSISVTIGDDQVLIDKKHEWLLSKYKWHVGYYKKRDKKYVCRKEGKSLIMLHRLIVAIEQKDPLFLVRTHIYVDHINGVGTDNRYQNLRESSNSLNQINKKIQINSTTGYKGVSYCKKTKKFHVRITIERGIRKHYGYFDCKHKAAIKYNEVVSGIWGNNVILNKIRK